MGTGPPERCGGAAPGGNMPGTIPIGIPIGGPLGGPRGGPLGESPSSSPPADSSPFPISLVPSSWVPVKYRSVVACPFSPCSVVAYHPGLSSQGHGFEFRRGRLVMIHALITS